MSFAGGPEATNRTDATNHIDEGPLGSTEGGAWVDGFGVTAPDVTRYADVVRALPDRITLAMRNVAEAEGLTIVDPDTAALCGLLLRDLAGGRVVEAGTGIGYLTLLMARVVPSDCTITSVEFDPIRQAQAHAFFEREDPACAVELLLGDPGRVLERELTSPIDALVLTDPRLKRLDLVDQLTSRLAPGGLLLVPHALRGGRVADAGEAWGGDPEVEGQRLLNRCIATDPRYTNVVLVPIGDGLLVARRRA